ncbi:hypothetical protein P3T40_007929 [Paraburkholderia sp. EB58]|jgi:hypothetical protein|uniref:DUF7706 family protein n=1 Tax=Paraburkholderia sp. EB58 TaxID=3035125 RepID=UPI003D21CDF9
MLGVDTSALRAISAPQSFSPNHPPVTATEFGALFEEAKPLAGYLDNTKAREQAITGVFRPEEIPQCAERRCSATSWSRRRHGKPTSEENAVEPKWVEISVRVTEEVAIQLAQFCKRSMFDHFYELTEAHLPHEERRRRA